MLMNRWKWSGCSVALMLGMVSAVPFVQAQKADAKSIEATIAKMEMDSRTADLAGKNGAWMKAHDTGDYIMGTSWGAWEDNAALQKDAADTANNKATKRDISDMKVTVYGNSTAIARYKETYDLLIRGEHRARTILTTDTWVNQGGWKLAASHSSQADQKIGD